MSSISKTIVLVTGANSGIGFELASQLLEKGTYHVLMGSRSIDKGNLALKELQSRNFPGTAELLQLDLTDDDIIARAASLIKETHGKLDVLVNNAAVALPGGTEREQLKIAFDTNATGPYILTKALLPMLQQSKGARIINVSSGVGSIGRKLDPTSPLHKISGVQYRASKTALNMVSACQFVEYGDIGIKVFLYDPGFTISNLGPQNNAESGARSAKESVEPLMDVLEGKRDDECGKFLHNTGMWPW